MLTSLESGNKRGVVLVLAMLLLFYAKACGRRRYYIIIISVAHVYNTNSSVARLDIFKDIILAEAGWKSEDVCLSLTETILIPPVGKITQYEIFYSTIILVIHVTPTNLWYNSLW